MALALFLVLIILVAVLLFAAFPPQSAHRWRRVTRPIRRLVRPGHYRW